MAASSVKRERYREYTQFLRLSADRLNMSVAPARLERLQRQVNSERNTFLAWEVVWLLIGVACLMPALMLFAVEFSLPLPAPIAARAEVLYFRLVSLQNGTAEFVAIGSTAIFLVSVGAAFAPIIAHGNAINDLEYTHRVLKAAARG